MPVDHTLVNDAFDRIQEAVNEIINATETLSEDELGVLRTNLYDYEDYARHQEGEDAAKIIQSIYKFARCNERVN